MKIININNKKFKHKPLDANKEFILQEIKVNFVSKFHHIVRLQNYSTYSDFYIILLEYMENFDLKYLMKQFNGPVKFSELTVGYFIYQILKAIEFLKNMSILHRDIKPENILVGGDYTLKLGDFTLARRIERNASVKPSRSGTLPYLAPECIRRKIEVNYQDFEKMDLFSLGVVMYFLLYNRHPYGYKNSMTMISYPKKLDETKLEFNGRVISDGCKDLLRGLLQKDIKNRISINQALNHHWIKQVVRLIKDYENRYGYDKLYMIKQMNKRIGVESDNENDIYCNDYSLNVETSHLIRKKRDKPLTESSNTGLKV